MTVSKRTLALDKRTLATALVLVLAASLAIVDPALAQTATNPNNGPGKGLGEMLQSWAQWLLLGVAAIVGVPTAARHDVGVAFSLLISVVAVGIFAFMNAGQFENFVDPVIKSVTGK